nr:AAC(3) family N-acetyltransferase [Anaerolineae bacterium]
MAKELTAYEITCRLSDELGIDRHTNLLAHGLSAALGPVQGDAETVKSAVLDAAGTVVMPAFTYQTQIIPQTGPPDNALDYGTGDEMNARADIYRPSLPVHPDIGLIAEAFRNDPKTLRSIHPVLSFIAQGPNARAVLSSQTRENPLGPVAWLEMHDGLLLLMGVDQRHNYALHLAEQRAGRKTFTRWALTIDDIEELPNMPGCRDGFNAIWRELTPITRVAQIGMARCEVIPIKPLLEYAEQRIREEPDFLLCDQPGCLSCRTREVSPRL